MAIVQVTKKVINVRMEILKLDGDIQYKIVNIRRAKMIYQMPMFDEPTYQGLGSLDFYQLGSRTSKGAMINIRSDFYHS